MAYRVLAGYVSAETKVVGQSRAIVDHPRGSVLPDDVPAEQIERFLRLGQIERLDVERAAEPDEQTDELDGLDKDQLVALAEERGVEIDKRWGDKKIVAAIRENQK